ncbi:hypothetical protein ACU686_04965 [Yinghuangia aomiensis]
MEYDFVGRQKRWYAVSALILIPAVGGLLGRGLSKGIEFEGGAVYTVSKPGITVSQALRGDQRVPGDHEPIVQKVGGDKVRIQIASKDTAKFNDIKNALSNKLGVSQNNIRASWSAPVGARRSPTRPCRA